MSTQKFNFFSFSVISGLTRAEERRYHPTLETLRRRKHKYTTQHHDVDVEREREKA